MAIRHWHLDSGAIRVNNFPENEIQIAIPIKLLCDSRNIAIDSTGIKWYAGNFIVDEELVKHIKSAYLLAVADTPSATDATVEAELYDNTAGSVIASIEFAGVGGKKTTNISSDKFKNAVGHELLARLNVTTASATAGATQLFRSIVLVIKLGIS